MALPTTARVVRLTRKPQGLPVATDFTVAEEPLAAPGPGDAVVRNRAFLVFPGLRTLLGDEGANLPLPRLAPGDALFGPALGEVLAAPEDGPLHPGDLVVHLHGWRDAVVADTGQFTVVDQEFPEPLALISAASAGYGALTRTAEVRPGDVVLVTAAAGAVGSLAGRIARLLGAGRVIGTTRSPDKAERLVAELGYDAALVPGAARPFTEQLAEAAPDGVDVVLDLVGGEQLTAAVDAARPGARFALVGAVAGQLDPRRGGGSAPAVVDTFRIVTLGLSLRGFTLLDHPDLEAEWRERLAGWLRAGEITFPWTPVAGIDRAPEALSRLFTGDGFGTTVVEL
ncbi:MDR family NADP-dependent oxidoreductase [Streptomyces rubellomurinus]|uniref:Alcohol dehydrogenase n=1 Tax=Streptomyces rubellomurinus (strain ATCC 31215) TaxID=359131 RepID=A0A0F2T9D4_STRR3|nr:NADP-dependent oxidoreductase [Streptomyces rubellomurinus]KJS59823.1 alcohol dehydrogenase [Streptomyces rubellomurinus]